MIFSGPHKFQLRVYLFQARDLLPADSDGLSGEKFGWKNNVTQRIRSIGGERRFLWSNPLHTWCGDLCKGAEALCGVAMDDRIV